MTVKSKKKHIKDVAPSDADPAYTEVKEKLMKAVDITMERKFAEEVDFLNSLNAEHLIAETFNVDFRKGINTSEVEERRIKHGTNKKEEVKGSSYLGLLWAALGDFTLRILLAASALSIILNVSTEADHRSTAWIEGFAIFMAVMISSNVQAFNDFQKEKQFRKLNSVADSRKTLSVIRDDGKTYDLHQSELVPGDIVSINEGTDIPADGFVLEAHGLSADESAMTGETDPIKKNTLHECLKIKGEIEEEGRENVGAHEVPSPILLAGTKVAAGTGKYVVIVVGKDSSLGKIRDLLEQDADATPLQQKLEKIAGDIGKFGLGSAIFVLLVLFIRFLIDRGRHSDWNDGSKWIDLLHFFIIAVTVVVVAIPEGLPLAVALSLAYSVGRMLKDQNLVRKLQACETMGGANMICSDKTGTLTQNKMDLSCFWNQSIVNVDVYTKDQDINKYFNEGTYREAFIQACACNSSATLEPLKGSKTDIALLQFVQNVGVDPVKMKNIHVTENSVIFPFTSKRKRMSTVIENVASGVLSGKRMHIKGASEYILEACNQMHIMESDRIVPITTEARAQINEAIKTMANNALRTIGIGYKEIVGGEDFTTADHLDVHSIEKEGFILLAILGIKDMLRNEVKDAVAKCKAAGIKVRMVTGDNKDTARAIAKECGIIDPATMTAESVLEGPEFDKRVGGVICKACKTKVCDCARDKKSAAKKGKPVREDTIQNKEEFARIIAHLDVLARSRPEDKYTLVTGLRELDNVVAVTGDGTNDAPALKKADVGFAMGIAGTEVAREAADIILLDDNFNSIVAAVLWGRNIYDSIRKFLQFQLTVNVVAVGLTLFGSALYRMAILAPVQMLWVNLIMDTLASLALATESPSPKLLTRHPHDKNEYILSRKMIKFIVCHSIYQILILLIMTCLGDQFIPEWADLDPTSTDFANGTQIRFSDYPGNGEYKYVRSGRLYQLNGDDDYAPYIASVGASRHMTVIFDTFVFMQIFNFVNARKLEDEVNIFEGLHRSPLFIIIVIFIVACQIILGMFGGRVISVFRDGTNIAQWGIAIAFASGEWVVGVLIKFIPDKLFPQLGAKKQDPIHHPSKILGVKRSLEVRSNTIKQTTFIGQPDPARVSLTNKSQQHQEP